WTNSYYEASMKILAPLFGLTVPPALPKLSDETAVAAIFDRVAHMRFSLTGSAVTFEKVPVGAGWEAGPGQHVKVTSAFFALSPQDKVNVLLANLVRATSDVSPALAPKYTSLIKKLAARGGYGHP